jgi:hypothetical protein
MSAHWLLAYLKTGADSPAVAEAVRAALRAEVDGKLYEHSRKVTFPYPPHDYAPARADFDREAVYARNQPSILLYPPKNGLYTIQWLCFFSPMNIMLSDRESREGFARAVAAERQTGELFGSALLWDMAPVIFPEMLRELSRLLDAEIAQVLFLRNPAVDVTAVQFYRRGQYVAEFFSRYYEGIPDRLDIPPAEAVSDLMDGRFRFVCSPPKTFEDGFVRHFSAEDFGSATVNPEFSSYTPDTSRLFVPFWIKDFKPFGIISYDLEGLLDRRYVKGSAPRPVIHEIHPPCVLRSAEDAARRRLILTGEHFPVIHHGLQFQNQATGRLSIIFDMEVSWEGMARISVDMARIKHLLWPDRRLPLRVRIMDTENANYQPISDWSVVFTLADDATACPSDP